MENKARGRGKSKKDGKKQRGGAASISSGTQLPSSFLAARKEPRNEVS